MASLAVEMASDDRPARAYTDIRINARGVLAEPSPVHQKWKSPSRAATIGLLVINRSSSSTKSPVAAGK